MPDHLDPATLAVVRRCLAAKLQKFAAGPEAQSRMEQAKDRGYMDGLEAAYLAIRALAPDAAAEREGGVDA